MSARTPTRPATTFRAMLLLTAVAMAGVAARFARVPVLFPHTALVSSEGERYLFTSFPRFEGEAAVMFRYLAKDRKLTRLAIAHDPNAYGLVFRDRLRAHATGFGVRGRRRRDRFGRLVVEDMERAGRALTRERFIEAMEGIVGWDASSLSRTGSLRSDYGE